MRLSVIPLLVGLAAVGLLASAASAVDFRKGIVFDIPEEAIESELGKRVPLELTEEELRALWEYRHDADTLKVLVIPVEWSNRLHTYSTATFDSMLFSRGVYPGGSVADYFYEVSYGQITVVGDVLDWYNAGTYTGYFDFEEILPGLDPYVDFSEYDANGDSVVDAVIFLRSGTGEEYSHDPYDIWSYAYIYAMGYGPGPFDGMHVSRWNTSPELYPQRNPDFPQYFSGEDTLNDIGVFCHELTHNLGAPDLYDYDAKLNVDTYDTPADSNDHPVYDWCLMGYGGYGIFSLKSSVPPHLCGWIKKSLGWLEPIELKGTFTDLVIYDVETHADSSLYMLPINPYEGEYFLLEYRNPSSSGMFDKTNSDFSCFFWPDLTYGADTLDRGLLITHVNDSLCKSWWCYNNGWPEYPNYMVVVEDAGYNPDHDASSNPEGHVTDSAQWWYPYETRIGALFSDDVPGQDLFGPETYPSSDGYDWPTGIIVRVDSIVDDRMYLYVHNPVEFPQVAEVTPAPNAINIVGDSVTVTFTGDIDPATVNENTLKVYSQWFGYLPGTLGFDAETKRAVYELSQPLIPGDKLIVQVTSNIQTSGGIPLMNGYVWEYRVAGSAGYGLFGLFESIDVGITASGVAAADFDGDGDLDLAAVLPDDDAVAVLVNDGSGAFAMATYGVADEPWDLVACAIDDDDDIDLVVGGHGTNLMDFLANNGAGVFVPYTQEDLWATTECLAFADFDGDGHFDIATGGYMDPTAGVLYHEGGGNFIHDIIMYGPDPNYHPQDLSPFDMEPDGDIDLALTWGDDEGVQIYEDYNGGLGRLCQLPDSIYPTAVTAADFDGDGDIDLAAASADSVCIAVYLFNGGDTLVSHYLIGAGAFDMITADLDGDGDFDLAVTDAGANSVSVFHNNGDGSFASRYDYLTGGGSPLSLCAGDFTGDGMIDLAVANHDNGTIAILENNEGYVCGDADGNQSVNVSDAVYIITYIFKGGPPPVPLEAGDANCDLTLNVSDAVYLINYIFKGGPEPCCP